LELIMPPQVVVSLFGELRVYTVSLLPAASNFLFYVTPNELVVVT
jgi:hypothetical protein